MGIKYDKWEISKDETGNTFKSHNKERKFVEFNTHKVDRKHDKQSKQGIVYLTSFLT